MRKPTEKSLRRQKRQAYLRERERAKPRRKKTRKGSNRKAAAQFVPPANAITAPRRIDIFEPHGRALKQFLATVAQRVLVDKQAVVLNFRETEGLVVTGAILMFAELDRIASLSTIEKPLTILNPRRRRALEVIKQIGLHEVTKDVCDTVPHREDVVYWRTAKGRDQSGTNLAIVEYVADTVEKGYERGVVLGGLWRGVSEATANSIDHAYKKPRADGFQGLDGTRWWMFAQVRDDWLFMAVCDLGCGYRATVGETLPERFLSEFAAALTGASKDARAIEAAMEYGRTGTREGHRGKGSRDALSVLETHKDGQMMIASNKGYATYEYKDGAQSTHRSGSLPASIRGTIVWWRLPLVSQADAQS